MKNLILLAAGACLIAGCSSQSHFYRPKPDPELGMSVALPEVKSPVMTAPTVPAPAPAAAPLRRGRVDAEGFTVIFDGTWDGWIINENPQAWKIVNRQSFRASGPRSHAFYIGDSVPFKDFELKVDVKTEANSNGGIYFHTRYQDEGWPRHGFETQVNVSHGDWKKTGSLYDVVNVRETPAQDEKWWTQHIIVRGNRVIVKVDDQVVVDYTEPADKQPGADFTRKLDQGTFALQCHDPNSVVYYRNIRVKRL